MPLTQLLLINAAVLFGLFTLLWLVSLARKDVSIVDPAWGPMFVVVVWLSYLLAPGRTAAMLLLAVMVTLWGLRLGGYLLWRNWGEGEDKRYASMREAHGSSFAWVSLFKVFWLQAAIAWVVSLPLQVGMHEGLAWRPWALVGVAVWLVGLVFESVGDLQLARFKADPANEGEVLDHGLWRYTRHPNYFGDFLVWWGLYLTAATTASWWWTLASPVLMSVLLMRVSGVTLLEDSLSRRLDQYERYRRRTSAFFPLPPKDDPEQTSHL